MNKRGLSHVEVILSFVIFIGFLIFALVFFNPLDSNRLLDSSLTYAYDEVIEESSTHLEIYSVVADNVVGEIIKIPIENPKNLKVREEDYERTKLSAKYEFDGVMVDTTGLDNKELFTVMFSEEFKENEGMASSNNAIGVISSSEEKEILSEKKINDLAARYANDYLALKKDFNLPNRVDFAFSLNFDDSSIVAERPSGIPSGLEVFSKNERIEVLKADDGDIVFADLIVKVW